MPGFLTILAGIVTLLAVAVYLFGIPPELKRKMERAALQTMGENKASYLVKGEQHHSFCTVHVNQRSRLKSRLHRPNLQDASFRSGKRQGLEEGLE
jgi:hypothetical protein